MNKINPASLILGFSPTTIRLQEIAGHVVRELREQHDVKGEKVAKALGISQAQLSKIETGKATLTVDRILLVSEAFGISAALFMHHVENAIAELESKNIQVTTRKRGHDTKRRKTKRPAKAASLEKVRKKL